jgi:hypothetical protein
MVLTLDNAVYTNSCVLVLLGSNASLSKVNPCSLCIVLAQASCIGNCFRIVVRFFPLGHGNGFAIQNIGVQIGEIFLS